MVDQRILDMETLKAEQKKFAKIRKASKRLRKRYRQAKLQFDPENPFCTEKRELDLQLMIAKNQNPRLNEPFRRPNAGRRHGQGPFSFQDQVDGASDIYSISKVNAKKFNEPWVETPMAQLKHLGLNRGVAKREKWQRSLDRFNAQLIDSDAAAQPRIDDEARRPQMHKHRPGNYHVPGQDEDIPRNNSVVVSELYPLMSVLDLRNLLHNDPEHKPPPLVVVKGGSGGDDEDSEGSASQSPQRPDPASVFNKKNRKAVGLQPEAMPKFHMTEVDEFGNPQSKPTPGGLHNKRVRKATLRAEARRLAQRGAAGPSTRGSRPGTHPGPAARRGKAAKTRRSKTTKNRDWTERERGFDTRIIKAKVGGAFSGGNSRNATTSPATHHSDDAYSKISRFTMKAAGKTPSPFRTNLDNDYKSANQTNLVDQPLFLSVMSRQQIRTLLSQPFTDAGDAEAQDAAENSGGEGGAATVGEEEAARLRFAEAWLRQVLIRVKDLRLSNPARALQVIVQGIDGTSDGEYYLPDDNEVMNSALELRDELQRQIPAKPKVVRQRPRSGRSTGSRKGGTAGDRGGSDRRGSDRGRDARDGGSGLGDVEDNYEDPMAIVYAEHSRYRDEVESTKNQYEDGTMGASEAIPKLSAIREAVRDATLAESQELGFVVDKLIEMIEDRELTKLQRRRLQIEAGVHEANSSRASKRKELNVAESESKARVQRAVGALRTSINAVRKARNDMSCVKALQDAIQEAQDAGLDEGQHLFVDAQLLLREVRSVSAADIEDAERELQELVKAAEADGNVKELLRLYSDEKFSVLSPDSSPAMLELRAALERVRANKMTYRQAEMLSKTHHRGSTKAASVFTAAASLSQLTKLRSRLKLARQNLHRNEATLRTKLSNREAKSAAALVEAINDAKESQAPGPLAFELCRAVLLGVSPTITSQAEECFMNITGWDWGSFSAPGLASSVRAKSGKKRKSALDLLLEAENEGHKPKEEEKKEKEKPLDPVEALLEGESACFKVTGAQERQLFRLVLRSSPKLAPSSGQCPPIQELLGELETLSQDEDFDIDCMDARGRTPLLLSVSIEGVPVEMISAIIDLEADLYGGDRCRDGAVCTPLYTAIRQHNAGAVKALVKHLEPEEAAEFLGYTPDCECYSPLALASVLGATDMVDCLLEAGASPPVVDHPLQSAEYTELDYSLVACEFSVLNRLLLSLPSSSGDDVPEVDAIAQNILLIAHRFNLSVAREIGESFKQPVDEAALDAMRTEGKELFHKLLAESPLPKKPKSSDLSVGDEDDEHPPEPAIADTTVVAWLAAAVDAGGGSDRTTKQRFDLHFTMLSSVVLSRLREFHRVNLPQHDAQGGFDAHGHKRHFDALVRPPTRGDVTEGCFVDWYVNHYRRRISAAARSGKIQYSIVLRSSLRKKGPSRSSTRRLARSNSSARSRSVSPVPRGGDDDDDDDDAMCIPSINSMISAARSQGRTGYGVDYPQFLSACESNDVAEVIGLVVQCGANVHFDGTAAGVAQEELDAATEEDDNNTKAVVREDVVEQHFTPLMIAANAGATEVCRALLALKADPNAQAVDGSTALILAAYKNHARVVHCLLTHSKKRIDISKQLHEDNATALFIASQQGHADVMKEFVAAAEYLNPGLRKIVNEPVSYGAFPLYIAASLNHAECISMLATVDGIDLDKYENVAAAGDDGGEASWQSALFSAVHHRHIESIEALMLANADIHSQPPDAQMSPLMLAVYEGDHDIAALMLKVGFAFASCLIVDCVAGVCCGLPNSTVCLVVVFA